MNLIPDAEGEMPLCFVAMGFGRKTDFETDRTFDLGSGLIAHIQKMTMAAITMADMKVWAQRS